MRKKITKLPTRNPALLPRPVLTFDNPDYSSHLLEAPQQRVGGLQTLRRNLQTLALSAAQAGTLCLANNQIMGEQRLLAIHKAPLRDEAHADSAKWISLDYSEPQHYEVVAEPEILWAEGLVEQHEESISLPFLNFFVRRYRRVRVRFRNGRNEEEEREVEGLGSFAWQQGVEQLAGTILFDWRVNHGNLYF